MINKMNHYYLAKILKPHLYFKHTKGNNVLSVERKKGFNNILMGSLKDNYIQIFLQSLLYFMENQHLLVFLLQQELQHKDS